VLDSLLPGTFRFGYADLAFAVDFAFCVALDRDFVLAVAATAVSS
jgi:hypothetical protein